MKKLLPFVIFIILLVACVYILLVSSSNKDPDPVSQIQNSTSSTKIPEGWATSSYPEYKMEISTPALATISKTVENLVIVYMGEKQKASGRTQTELADGFIISFSKVKLEENQTIDQFANLKIEQTKNDCPSDGIVTNLDESEVGKIPAKVYSVRNCRNDYDIYYVTIDDMPLEITLLYMGFTAEDASAHKFMAETVLNTLKTL